MSNRHQEFIEAHAGVLDTIATETERYVADASDGVVVLRNSYHGVPVILEGAYTADDILDEYSDLPSLVAQEVADYVAGSRNRTLEGQADSALDFLLLGASIASDFELVEKGKLTPKEAMERDLLRYNYGIYRSVGRTVADGITTVELVHAKLQGLEYFDTADALSVIETDEVGLSNQLRIHRLGSVITHVAQDVRPDRDPLTKRCAELLGVDTVNVQPFLTGRYTDEEELDEALSVVWLSYQGSSKEEEVTSLLDDVRLRAIAVKESRDLSVAHDASLPSAEQLERVAGTLRNL